MKKAISLLLTALMLLCLFSCSDKKVGNETTAAIIKTDEKQTDYSADVNEEKDFDIGIETANLAFRILKKNLDTPNAVISPISIATALTVVGGGAKGKTLEEISDFFGCNISEIQNGIERYVKETNSDSKLGITLANSVWFNGQNGRLTINSDYEKMCTERFGAEVFKDNFHTSNTARKINLWISEKTDKRINNVIENVSKEAVAYVINSVLFESEWQTNYLANDCIPNSTFTTESGKKQTVTMLKSAETVNDALNFRLGKTEVVCKSYKNGYSFAGILPDEGVSLKKALDSFSGKDFVKAVTNPLIDENGEKLYGIHCVNLLLPKFEFKCSFKLSDTLKSMGIKKAFDSDADFSGMAVSSMGNIYINEVYHNTYIRFSENGTEAAASTVVEMFDECAKSQPANTREIIFDRPFIYVIFSPEGIPVFVGTVTDFEA